MSAGAILTEREIRFEVDPGFDPPDLRPLVGHTLRLPEQQMLTTYFDTADMRLWGQGLTLRHRQTTAEGDNPPDEGPGAWILGLPAEGSSGPVEQSELSWPGPLDSVPSEARRVLAGLVRREPLGPVAELSITRRRLLLHEREADRPWAEIDDDLVTVTSGPEPGRRFRQMELELTAGAAAFPVATEAVMSELRSAGAAPAGRPKLAVALDLPDVAAEPFTGDSGLANLVKEVIGQGLRSLLHEDYRLRLRLEGDSEASVENVHQARVATRRLRSNIRTLRSAFDPVWEGHLSDDLKWLGGALGRVRDLDVITERLERESKPSDQESLEALFHLAAAERRLAARELGRMLEEERYFDLLDRLHAATERPPLMGETVGEPGAGEDVLKQTIVDQYRELEQRADHLDPDPDDASLHRLRIEAKRLRYAAEVAQPLFGKSARRAARRAKRLQTVLGDVHDRAMTAEWLQQQASHPSITPTTAFVAGRLACETRHSVGELRAAWRKDLRRLSAKKVARAWGK